MFAKTSDFHLFMSPALALASSWRCCRALSIFAMERLPRLIYILHHNIEAAKTERWEIIYDISLGSDRGSDVGARAANLVS